MDPHKVLLCCKSARYFVHDWVLLLGETETESVFVCVREREREREGVCVMSNDGV